MSKTKRTTQEIVIVMDKSGSMSVSRDDVIGGFNTYIKDLQKDESINAKLTFFMFDNNVHNLYSGKPIKDVGELSHATYSPNGSTALNDAVMEAIKDVDTRISKSKAKTKSQVVVVVFTDGEENASKKYRDKDEIKKLRSEKEQEGWAFIFMGADMDAWSGAAAYGMSAGNTMSMGRSAIQASASYLSNRTKKAAIMHESMVTGKISAESYTKTMNNLMTLDEDDLVNDAEAVSLREKIDSSVSSSGSSPCQIAQIEHTIIDKLADLKKINQKAIGVQKVFPPINQLPSPRVSWKLGPAEREELGKPPIAKFVKSSKCCDRDFDEDGNCDVHKS